MKHRSHLRTRITLLAVLPGVACALLIGIYLSYALIRDISHYEKNMGNAYSEQIALQSFTALQAGDIHSLENGARLALEYPLLRAITFYDAQGRELAHAGPRHQTLPESSPLRQHFGNTLTEWQSDESRLVFAPVTTPKLSGRMDSNDSNRIAGWVQLEFSHSFMMLHKYRTILIDILVIVIVLSCTFWVALPFGDNLANALRNLARTARAIGHGNTTVQIPDSTIIELQDLGNALAEMQANAAEQQANLQHHIEQSTQDLRETLETIEIQNIELDLARREAVQASRTKSEFLANTSHEIRTPLNSIIGFSKLLLKTSLSIQQHDYLQNIRKSSENLLTIINDVLDLSKIEAGKLVLDYVAFDINETLEEILQILAPGAHEKGLELLHMVYSDVPRHLLGDPLRLKQVLTNLISNAIKFCDQGTIVVRVSSDNPGNQQTLLRIEVTDSGKGLPNNNQMIFNAFTQLDSSSTREYAGTGLGLAISRKIVEQMGGDIGYTSEPGNTTFWFTVRLDIAQQANDTQPRMELHGRHVLVCDRERLCRLTISHSLTHWGIQPILTEQPAQIAPSLEHYQGSEHPVDAILLGLPVRHRPHDTEELLKTARQFTQQYSCPVLLCIPTGARQDLAAQTLDDNRLSILLKPVTEERLYQALLGAFGLTEEPANRPAPLAEKPEEGTTLQVLAVDDNPSNLKLLCTMLKDLGVIVHEASNGEEAVQVFRDNRDRIGIVFMDIQMPVMDGIDATRRIRQMEEGSGKHTPVIALTAHALAEQRQHLLMSGLDDYLSKPATDQQLQQVIARWCQRSTPEPVRESPAQGSVRHIPGGMPRVVVDPEVALRASGNRVAIAAEMLEKLLASLAADQQAILAALEAEDHTNAEALVHRLHGGCCYCGVTELRVACHAMETLLKKGITEHLPDVIRRFNEAVEALLHWRKVQDPATFLQFHADKASRG